MTNILVACPTLEKELKQIIKETGFSSQVCFLPKHLHNDPARMNRYLQEMIDGFQQVDNILLCVSGCGGSTIGLKATTARLVIPRTRDCIDLLLSQREDSKIERPEKGIFLTEGWMNLMKNSAMSLERMTENLGREKAEANLRKIYTGFRDFYVIDTGVYNTQPVKEYISPLVEVVDGTISKLSGEYGLLRKLLLEEWDRNFIVVPQGGQVTKEDFIKE